MWDRTNWHLWHRPVLTLEKPEAGGLWPLWLPKESKSRPNEYFVPKKIGDLTVVDNRVVLCEYMEQVPPMMSNVGMASRFTTFYKKKRSNDNFIPVVEDGEVKLISEGEENPFKLIDFPLGQPVTTLGNSMFVAPVVMHPVPSSDFLLTRRGTGWIIREASAAYVVGQQQPLMTVKEPRDAESCMNSRLSAHIHRQLRKSDTLRLSLLKMLIPDWAGRDHRFTNRLMELHFNPDHRGGDRDVWRHEPPIGHQPASEQSIKDFLKPEDVCLYESMYVYNLRLEAMGIGRRAELKAVENSTKVHNCAFSVPACSLQKAARFVNLQLQLAPWNTSSNFLAAIVKKHTLSLNTATMSTLVPFTKSHALSYQRAASKIEKKVMGDKGLNNILKEKGIGDKKQSIFNTNKDLRKLHKPELIELSQRFGAGLEDVREQLDNIHSMERWCDVTCGCRL
jgi:hypothetical protein